MQCRDQLKPAVESPTVQMQGFMPYLQAAQADLQRHCRCHDHEGRGAANEPTLLRAGEATSLQLSENCLAQLVGPETQPCAEHLTQHPTLQSLQGIAGRSTSYNTY